MHTNNTSWYTIKYLLTLFVAVLIPVYWYYYGPENFLWVSDVGLLLTVAALWVQSTLLMSIAAVLAFAMEISWMLDFFSKLIVDVHITGVTDYMFVATNPLFLRALSFFHFVTPVIWIFYLQQFGYNKKAVWYSTFLWLTSLAIIYCCTNSSSNINWVFFPQVHHLTLSPQLWLLIVAGGFPLIILIPTHYFLSKLFKPF